jgi:hypothetical protein
MLWELLNELRNETAGHNPDNAAAKADSAAAKADDSRIVIADLRRKVERMALACQAMWELTRAQSGLDDRDIERKIEEIDARDGSPDGRMSGRLVPCPACGRTTHSKRPACLYCGAPGFSIGLQIDDDHAVVGGRCGGGAMAHGAPFGGDPDLVDALEGPVVRVGVAWSAAGGAVAVEVAAGELANGGVVGGGVEVAADLAALCRECKVFLRGTGHAL